MMQEPAVMDAEPDSQSTGHLVHILMQFALAVRYRKNVVIAALIVSGLLGGLYYATATRYYSSKASLFVMQSGHDIMDPSTVPQGDVQQGLMPTYEHLITSAEVLKGALSYLRPEDCVDMADLPREKWVKVLQENISARTVRYTNIIEIAYRSKAPSAAAAVVDAVAQSYLDFVDKTYKGAASEIIRVLREEKVELEEELATKKQQLQDAREYVGYLGTGNDDNPRHPMVQRVISLNEALIETRKERVEIEASLAAIQAAIRNGEGLQNHIMTVANVVGKEILLTALGINDSAAANQASLERSLLRDRAELKTLQEHFGPAHPRVIAMERVIRETQEYLLGYQDRVNQRLVEIQDTRLGPLLTEMMRQKLSETRGRELSLQMQYEQAYDEASSVIGQLAQIETMEHEVKGLEDWDGMLLNKIMDIDMKQEGPDIRVAVVDEPEKASAPVSPNLRHVILMVLVTGIAAGLMGVYVLDILDDRFRCLEELQRQLAAPVLAIVGQLEPSQKTGLESLQVYAQPDAVESEPFRTLRTALSLADDQSHRIVISSAEPGDGKTTILANLAVAYTQSEKRTLLIDADLRRPGLTALLGLRRCDGLSAVIRSEEEVAEMAAGCIQASGLEGLDVLPSGPRPTNPAELLAHPRFSELLSWAETVYDQILIDSPPGLAASDAAVIGRLVDGVILVVQPDKNRRRMVLRAAETLAVLKIALLGVVVNRVSTEKDGGYYGYGSGYAYHYRYAAHGDHEEEDPDLEVDPSVVSRPSRSDEADPPGKIVPRRAA